MPRVSRIARAPRFDRTHASGNRASAALRLDAVSCVRGGRSVFRSISLALAAGDAALVLGPNGVGKSSLVRIAAGLLAPSAGRLTIAGNRALLTEAPALDGDLPLARALGFWARIDRPGVQADRVVGAALAAFDLTALAAIPVRFLSTGQRKRAGLARVVASGADIWLLDEPANGLDAPAGAMLEAAIAVHRGRGGIALVATHVPIALPGAQTIVLGRPA